MRTMVCACEDVTADDVREAIAKGYADIESVKRYTGFGTGFCQGKSCLAGIRGWLCERGGLSTSQAAPFTPRPPESPVELRHLATLPIGALPPGEAGVPPLPELEDQSALRAREPLPAHCNVAIIGGGIMGLALAYNLAKRGVRDVVVIEGSYLCAGASGRNGGGVRMQWNSATNIRLARRSIEIMKSFARELGINIWLRQGGYLFLARNAEVAQRLQRAAELQSHHGVRTELLSPSAAGELVPQLDTRSVVAAAFNPDDGVIFPWPFLWGYAHGAERLGARVETFTRVEGIEVTQGRVRAVRTDRGRMACDVLVNAAGAWSPQIARLAGVAVPNKPHRHEIFTSEPMKPFLGPLVTVLDSSLYFSQSMRGEIVAGMGDPDDPSGLKSGSTLRFLARISQALLATMPTLGHVKVVRQWAGCYDVTPDNAPILGEVDDVTGFLQMHGFVGHGFMMAPAVAELMADWMAGGPRDDIFDRFALSRFAEGRSEREDFIIG